MPSESVTETLEDLKAGVEASDTTAVKDAVDELQAEYDRIETSEQVLLQQAVAARDKTSLSRERRQTLDSLARTTASVSLPRSSILTFGAYYVTAPEQVDDSRIIETADTLADEESTLVEHAEQAEPIVEDVAIPPTLAFTELVAPDAAQPKGPTFGIDVTVQNVGDETTESVAVSAASDLPLSPRSADFGALAPDTTAGATFEASAATAGTFTVELSAEGDDADTVSESVEVTVLDKAGYVDRIREDLDGAMQTLGEAGLPRGTAKGVESKLEAAIRKVDDAERFVERGKAKQANNMLTAAANVLGAALNQLDAGSNGNGNGGGRGNGTGGRNGNDDREPGLVFGVVESLIDEIATAKTAEL
ncbi:COG1361 family protein [Halorussus salinisoli]|uniref:PKD domain-containing protein n=1 Tax=Halorussus salinisoli TaxID=2558242 RepID=UPI0010C1F375|nr:PKD domain-containing protein [Halorussus salinisoli]